jgi:hypothetical protein
MLEQMDFPLVSVAFSYDAFHPLDAQKVDSIGVTLPHYGLIPRILTTNDTRDPTTWKATGPGQVLNRNATATRHDYKGQGIMAGLAQWLMREADHRGFRGIQIAVLSDAVTHVWSTAELPCKGSVVSEFHTSTWRDEDGKLAFEPAQQRVYEMLCRFETET